MFNVFEPINSLFTCLFRNYKFNNFCNCDFIQRYPPEKLFKKLENQFPYFAENDIKLYNLIINLLVSILIDLLSEKEKQLTEPCSSNSEKSNFGIEYLANLRTELSRNYFVFCHVF